MKKSFYLISVFVFLVFSCQHKAKNNLDFFLKGKKVSTGFIWQPSEISLSDILKTYKKHLIFEDNFDQNNNFNKQWNIQGGDWHLKNGKLVSTFAYNKNLVLKDIVLPENLMISFDVLSKSNAVDVKVNVLGDGKIHGHGDGYSFILGGWHNQISVISKLNEHEKTRIESRKKWQKNKLYHMNIIKIGEKFYWFVNHKIFLARFDEIPLRPKDGYKFFSFGNWKTNEEFDNLKIYKLEKK